MSQTSLLIGLKKDNLRAKGNNRSKGDTALTPIEFSRVDTTANFFADHIEKHFQEITDILLDYESFEVVEDETARTLDLLRNLKENKQFFVLRVGSVASFLPRNQPLYSLVCFVIVPSLMASEVSFRIPHSMQEFFPRLLRTLRISDFFPNVIVSQKERLKFLRERAALRIDPKNENSMPVTDVVIFTGAYYHAERLRLVFDQRTLFIANGAGHNPIVISEDADIEKATQAATSLQLYNQGQDCSAPNSILIHRHCFQPFMRILHEKIAKIKVGHYRDRSCSVGPISEPEDLKRIQSILVDNRKWLDPHTPGIIRAHDAIVEPTIICKSLKEGGNFTEVFAPIFFVQQYDDDDDLALYFEDPRYSTNAMFISLYGTSRFIESLINRSIAGRILHDSSSVLRDTHPHAPGVERGTQPYGGYGNYTSSISINGKITPKPTLPQRDIYENIVGPLLAHGKLEERKVALSTMNKILARDVSKLIGLKIREKDINRAVLSSRTYVDLLGISVKGKRYNSLSEDYFFHLLEQPNIEFIANMEPRHVHQVRVLRKFLLHRRKIQYDELLRFLYAIAKNPNSSERKNKEAQLAFFRNLYQLLLRKDEGPRLARFFLDIDRKHLIELLNV